jgi:hypothetical protein
MSVRKRTWISKVVGYSRCNETFIKKILQPIGGSAIYLPNKTRHASDGASAPNCAPRRVSCFQALVTD